MHIVEKCIHQAKVVYGVLKETYLHHQRGGETNELTGQTGRQAETTQTDKSISSGQPERQSD